MSTGTRASCKCADPFGVIRRVISFVLLLPLLLSSPRTPEIAISWGGGPSLEVPLRAWRPDKGLDKSKNSNFQLPKGPCGHDNRTKGLKSQTFSSQKAPAGTATGQRA